MSRLGAHLVLKADNITGLCCTIYEATLKVKQKKNGYKSASNLAVCFFFFLSPWFGLGSFERLYMEKRQISLTAQCSVKYSLNSLFLSNYF